ncbi:MAG: hypothetical protein JSV56_08065 [Methanomassiliicoccales archaeon]|nr:MAG: hypothetical protein JSV56_08065 [Methanomassiliicoccales archaeon]
MGVWVWLQPGNKIWKVISDYEKGTIIVYNEKGEILLEKRGLTREIISIIESNFLDVVATPLSGDKSDSDLREVSKTSTSLDIPMYA